MSNEPSAPELSTTQRPTDVVSEARVMIQLDPPSEFASTSGSAGSGMSKYPSMSMSFAEHVSYCCAENNQEAREIRKRIKKFFYYLSIFLTTVTGCIVIVAEAMNNINKIPNAVTPSTNSSA